MKRLLAVIGTRPEAIKMAPVIRAARATTGLTCGLCATAQHRDLLDQVLAVFDLTPDEDLNLMTSGQTLAALTARAVEGLDAILGRLRPDLVLIQGDTTTVLCAALAAFYQRIPVAHVEAGLRTGDLDAPWPEEANRVLAARLAALHFAPTERARQNLLREGIRPERVLVTGNTGIDALFSVRDAQSGQASVGASTRRTVLITAHRREAFGPQFEAICHAIADLAGRFPEVDFVYPVHPNPNVQVPVRAILRNSTDSRLSAGNVRLVAPLEYAAFVRAMAECTLILTDSGGIQEEAPSLGKPVLVLREVTERPEAVEAGTVRMVGTNRERIVREVAHLLTDPAVYRAMSRAHNPYGDGHASERIVGAVVAFLKDGRCPGLAG